MAVWPRFDPFLVPPAPRGNRTSANVYVSRSLGKRLGALLVDNRREIIGLFVALDGAGQTTFTDACEIDDRGRLREIGSVIIPLVHVQKLQERPQAK
jgi:hypothetical protein